MAATQTKSSSSSQIKHTHEERSPPQSSLIEAIKPWLFLLHIDKPAGTLVFYWPCIFGAFLISALADPAPTAKQMININLQLFIRSFLVHSVGSTWNEILDQDLDAKVDRCKGRPLPSGHITTRQALVATVLQFGLLYSSVYFMFGNIGLYNELLLTIFGLYYPLAKRHIFFPQIVLGICSGWGVFSAYTAVANQSNIPYTADTRTRIGLLFLACIAWANIFDTMHSVTDATYDAVIGVKSPMTLFKGHQRRRFFQAAAFIMCASMIFVSRSHEYDILITAANVLLIGISLWMVQSVNLNDDQDCEWWFAVGNPFLVAFCLCLPLAVMYAKAANYL